MPCCRLVASRRHISKYEMMLSVNGRLAPSSVEMQVYTDYPIGVMPIDLPCELAFTFFAPAL